MELRNFWWLLIWCIVGGFILDRYMPKETIDVLGKKEQRWRLGPALVLVLPYIIWAGTRWNFIDTTLYRKNFINTPSIISQWGQYLSEIDKDQGFYFFNLVIKTFITDSDVIYFTIIAAIQLLCIVLIFRKYSCNYWMSIFIFVAASEYMSWTWNGIRQFLAVAIIFAATPLILKKDYLKVVIVILLASTMHASALMMIPIVIIIQGRAWNKKTIMCILACVIALFFINQFTNILEVALSDTQYTNIVSDWQGWNDEGLNPIRVMVLAIPSLLSIVGIKIIKYENSPIIDLATNAGIIVVGLALIAMGTSGIYMGRLPIYVSLYSNGILLPWEIENFFTRDSSNFVKMIMVVCYVGFFYYQMGIIWGLL